jgi:hypothetical protein
VLSDAPRRRHAASAGGVRVGMEAGGALAAAPRSIDAAASTGVGVRNGVEVVAGGPLPSLRLGDGGRPPAPASTAESNAAAMSAPVEAGAAGSATAVAGGPDGGAALTPALFSIALVGKESEHVVGPAQAAAGRGSD